MSLSPSATRRVVAWSSHAIVVAAGAAQAWSYRFAMSPDGVVYLDLADRYARGEWSAALNGCWSPLYPALLGLAFRAASPTARGEFMLAHGVNLVLYLICYGTFLGLWGELRRSRSADPGFSRPVSDTWGRVAASALFLWVALGLVSLGFVVPDLAAMALVFATATLLVRMRRTEASWAAAAGFGLLLGLGYLTRAAFLLLAPVWLLVLYFQTRGRRGHLLRVALAGSVFVATAAPLVAGLSLTRGRVTFGDAGTLNYARYINRMMLTEPVTTMVGPELVHPVRTMSHSPPVYEFGYPVVGTYPPWTDPTYWMEGRRAQLDLAAQAAVIRHHMSRYGVIFAPLCAAGLLLIAALGRHAISGSLTGSAGLILPAAAGFALYAMVHVERRYLAPFAALLALGIVFGLRTPARVGAAAFLLGLGVGVTGLVAACGPANFVCGTGTTTPQMLVAAELLLGAFILARMVRDAAWRAPDVCCLAGLAGLAAVSSPSTFVAALAVALLAALIVSASTTGVSGRCLVRGTVAWALGLLVLPVLSNVVGALRSELRGGRAEGSGALETARGLVSQGLRPGDRVASIGNSLDAYWARAGGLRIVAEIPPSGTAAFWAADPKARDEVLALFAAAGAGAAVADLPANLPAPAGWIPVDSAHLLRRLDRPQAPQTRQAGSPGT